MANSFVANCAERVAFSDPGHRWTAIEVMNDWTGRGWGVLLPRFSIQIRPKWRRSVRFPSTSSEESPHSCKRQLCPTKKSSCFEHSYYRSWKLPNRECNLKFFKIVSLAHCIFSVILSSNRLRGLYCAGIPVMSASSCKLFGSRPVAPVEPGPPTARPGISPLSTSPAHLKINLQPLAVKYKKVLQEHKNENIWKHSHVDLNLWKKCPDFTKK